MTKLTPIETALKTAAERCAGLIPHKIHGEAEARDAEMLANDLRVVCARILDPVIESFGEYAAQHFRGVELDLFKEQATQAIDGNATFNLQDIADGLRESVEDDAAEMRRDFEFAGPAFR